MQFYLPVLTKGHLDKENVFCKIDLEINHSTALDSINCKVTKFCIIYSRIIHVAAEIKSVSLLKHTHTRTHFFQF